MYRSSGFAPVPVLAVAALLALAGCDVPRFEGPQVQSPPPGFTLNAETSQDRRLFPDRPVTHHDAWVRAQWGDFSGIYINAHPGPTSAEEVEAAREAARSAGGIRYDQVRDFEPVERLTIDGREAMGWVETIRSEARGLEMVAYRAVIPYDTVTYAVEFISGDPTFKNRPDSLRTIVASFAVGRVRYNIPLILMGAGVLLFLVAQARSRARERRLRAQAMVLPRIERKNPEEGRDGAPDEAGPAGSGRPGGRPPTPPPGPGRGTGPRTDPS